MGSTSGIRVTDIIKQHLACKSTRRACQERVGKKSRKSQETKSSQNGAGLVGKLSGHLGGVFLDYLEAPSSHIRQKMILTDLITKFN